jgi:gamma-glutamylcyclotransferase (GGCT)/AIG2-like uncharacterized protein YtfP
MASPTYLFTYGTLKPGERAYYSLCEPFAIALQPAQAQGQLYHLPLGYPAMTLEQGWVQGILICFADATPLVAIDAFEEYDPAAPTTSAYQRHLHPIYDLNQQPLSQAWVYTMPLERVLRLGGQWLAQGCWSEPGVT